MHARLSIGFNEISKHNSTFSSTPAGTTIGRKDREWGHIGVIIMAGTDGWIIDAPAATAVVKIKTKLIRTGGRLHP